MTTTEKAFASAMPAPSALPASSHTVDAAPKFNVNDIVMHFGRQYYTMLSCEPERLHCFYGKQSSMLHCQEDDVDASICVGIDEINQRVMSMGYNGARVVVSNIDCQQTLNGGIIIFVLGSMHWAALAPRKFVQTFLLAEQPNGYYVLNDILRLLTTSSADSLASQSSATSAAVKPRSVQAPTADGVVAPTTFKTTSVHVTEENVKAPVVEQAKPTTSAKTVGGKASQPAAAAYTTTPIASEKATPAVTVTEEKATEECLEKVESAAEASALSSWASLAAGQQGRWKSGVITESKNVTAAAPMDAYPKNAPKDTTSAQKEAPLASTGSSTRRVAYRTSSITREEATAAAPAKDGITSSADASRKTIVPRDRNATSPQASGSATVSTGGAPGKTLRTEKAERPEDRTPREKRDPPSYDIAKSIYVSAIDGKADRDELRKLFETFGTIKSCDILTSRGVAFVEYVNVESQQAALKGNISYNSVLLHIEARRSASFVRRPLRPSGPPKQIQA